METKKLSKSLLILAYALLAVSAILVIIAIFTNNDNTAMTPVMDLIAIISAVLYFAKGYGKDANKYFRIVMLISAFSFILDYVGLAIAPVSVETDSGFYFSLVLTMVTYGNILVLAVGKDLGKSNTFYIVIANIVIYIYNLVLSFSEPLPMILLSVEWLIVSVVTLIMAEAKYIDKANRGKE